ncbi:uncharacterized protein LOC122371134 isoform X1 [Amphibalanus amphitrite]|uniref:uncharacterized protein LOC122371134 isoform X1 n=1 Tax=Amphibalanus amphitrite TaxID=1232801 RepID=UPI001C91A8C5|nr:uncharacterized protein LOC122371134 isoform X1 [Amphibalanus amphitrite]
MNVSMVGDSRAALVSSMAIFATPSSTVAVPTPPPPPVPSSGYDLPVQGLQTGHFDMIHVTAIICLVGSLLCAIATIVLTLAANQWRMSAFYAWTTGDRVLIYMAVFDGLFNLTHMMDHGLYLAQRDHVRPRQLCAFFGFALSVLVIAQNVLVCFLALEACLMVFRLRPPNFGRHDWRPLAASLGPGVLFSAVAWALDKLGPSGAFCYLDPIKGSLFLMAFTTIFLIGVGLFNLVFYAVTVIRLRVADQHNRKQLGSRTQLGRSVNKTAWTCTYFIVSFFAQWLPMILYGAWAMRGHPPFELFMAVTTFTNLGGFFNLLLFSYIRLKKRRASHLSRQNAVRKRAGQRSVRAARAQVPIRRPAPAHGADQLRRLNGDSDTMESLAYSKVNACV